ncbi:MAG: hypothetical protein IKL82_05085 [Clostridia bacterium]|nr:hypothetical protein [Clostridia bacterium]
MYLKTQFKLKRFLIAMLAMMMAIMLAFSVACKADNDDGGDDDDDDSSTTTTITDYQSIKNGDFEFSTDEKTTYPYWASINWSKSVDTDATNAPASSGTSGIIDTSSDVYSKLSSKNKPTDSATGNIINPRTPYYYGLVANEYDYDDEDKRANAQTAGTKVLMINNKHRDINGLGTAQKFKSSSTLTVSEGSYAVLSFWVNTINLKTLNSTKTPGAYALLTSSIGSEAYNKFTLDGINTNGEWAKFSFYIEGSELGAVSLSLTFGLGRGNGTDTNDFVEGFAYFDNVTLKTITKAEYLANVSTEYDCESIPEYVNAPTSYADNGAEKNYADANASLYTSTDYKFNYATLGDGVTQVNGTISYNETDPGYDYSTSNFTKVGALSEFTNDEKAKFNGAFDNIASDIANNPSLIAFHFARQSTASFVSDVLSIEGDKYDYITFFAKVNANNSKSEGLKVELVDILSSDTDKDVSAFASITATEEQENGRYGDWIKYKIIVNNPTDKLAKYQIKITFGYDGEWNDSYALQTGYAVVANLSITSEVNEKYYSLATASSTVSKTQIYGVYTSYSDITEAETGNDVYNLAVDKAQTFAIQNRPATNITGYTFKATDKSSVVHGLINSKYVSGSVYGDGSTTITNVNEITSLNEGDNTYAQVMVLDNKVKTQSRYISNSNYVPLNEITKVTVKVRATGNAVANVYLVTSVVGENNDYEVLNFKPDDNFNQKMQATVTSSSHTIDGWTNVVFYVVAGNKDIHFRVEIRNGDRDSQEGSIGAIYSTGVIYNRVDASKYASDKNAYKKDFENLYQGNPDKVEYMFTNYDEYRRVPLVTKSLDEDGNEVTETTYFEPTEVYLGNALVKFFDYSTIDVETEVDNTSSSDDTTTDTEDEEETYEVNPSAALQITSIVIAIILIVVMAVVVIRNILKKRAKKLQKTQAYYEVVSGFDRDARQKAFDKIASKKRKIALAEKDEVEYDYDESQQIEEAVVEDVEEAEETENASEEIIIDEVVNEETEETQTNEPTSEE